MVLLLGFLAHGATPSGFAGAATTLADASVARSGPASRFEQLRHRRLVGRGAVAPGAAVALAGHEQDRGLRRRPPSFSSKAISLGMRRSSELATKRAGPAASRAPRPPRTSTASGSKPPRRPIQKTTSSAAATRHDAQPPAEAAEEAQVVADGVAQAAVAAVADDPGHGRVVGRGQDHRRRRRARRPRRTTGPGARARARRPWPPARRPSRGSRRSWPRPRSRRGGAGRRGARSSRARAGTAPS